MLGNIGKSDFLKNVLPLFLGNGAGQILLILLTPIITRIYSPESYGTLLLYLAGISVISIICSARYEQAILLPKEVNEAKSLVGLSLFISAGVCVITAFILFSASILLVSEKSWSFLYFLVPGIFLTGFFQVLTAWHNRISKFRTIAAANVTQTAATGTAQIVLGLFSAMPSSLILGTILGLFAGILRYTKSKIFRGYRIARDMEMASLVSSAKEYKEFPLYSMWGALLISVALQAPTFLIAAFFDAETVGQYGLSWRIVLIPATLLSTAFFQVLLRQVSVLAHDKFSEIRGYLFHKLASFAVLGLVPVAILSWTGEFIFGAIFGSQWSEAGRYSEYLVWAAYFKFCINPLMVVFNLKGFVRFGAYWQVLHFFTFGAMMCFLWIYESILTIDVFIQAVVWHEITMSMTCLGLIAYVTSQKGQLIYQGKK